MLVKIEEIGPKGRHLDLPVSEQDYEALLDEAGTGCHARSDVSVSLDLEKRVERVLVHGRLSSRVACPCRRCLGEVELDLSAEFGLDLRPKVPGVLPGLEGKDVEELGAGERAGSFNLEQADEDVYEGEGFDTWPFVREQLLLALPDYVLCREDCKGLCVVCGADLNAGDCGCDRSVPDPRLAGLKNIKLS